VKSWDGCFFYCISLQAMMRALSMPPLSDYAVWWSLADSKYGGTALFVKHCCTPLSVCFSLDQSGSLHLLAVTIT
jgi:hypothetical protein